MALLELYKKKNKKPHAVIMVKDTDVHHLEDHARPFAAATGDNVSLDIIRGDPGGPGHTPLPREIIIRRLLSMAERPSRREPHSSGIARPVPSGP